MSFARSIPRSGFCDTRFLFGVLELFWVETDIFWSRTERLRAWNPGRKIFIIGDVVTVDPHDSETWS